MERLRNNGGFALRLILLLTGLIFIGIGIGRGEAAVVLMKAIRICLECIGIG